MHRFVTAAAVLLLASPLALEGAEKLPTCEASVGSWEFVSNSAGRAVVTRSGAAYQALWIATVATAGASAENVGGAADCGCEAKPTLLAWKCRIAFSLRADEIGKDQSFEWAVEGEHLMSFPLGPDGKRAGGLAFRRRK